MEIKNYLSKTLDFIIKRLIEILGIIFVIIGILLFLALVSYSADDPNFIYSNDKVINNLLGFKGSVISDFFLQSIGLVSFLFAISIFFTGTNVIIKKKPLVILENFFFIIIYSLFGSLFLNFYYKASFWLPVNGNGGFVGEMLSNSFILSLVKLNEQIAFYILIVLVIFLFLLSINFRINFILSVIKFLFRKKNEDLNKAENLNQNEKILDTNTSRVQSNFSFEDITKPKSNSKIKYKLPSIDYLNSPSKKERLKKDSNQNYDEKSLEKILLDFGVEGEIKKVSYGPVVTLNEFEPAAGVKVSKVINLSEDIARNTSSESARISTIPGRSTIGIELPNNSRENVYLSEIVSSNDFSKKEIKLPIALGKSISGVPITGDLSSMPHLLIAGTTGSGKSVCINTIILSLLFRHTPEKCKFILIDPKMLELSTYEGIPHLLCPVITEAKKAASVLGWVVKEMESRYRLMTKDCLLYTSPSPRDATLSRMPSSA